MGLNVYIREEECSQINNLSFHLKKEKEQIKPNVSSNDEIIKSRSHYNRKRENRRKIIETTASSLKRSIN